MSLQLIDHLLNIKGDIRVLKWAEDGKEKDQHKLVVSLDSDGAYNALLILSRMIWRSAKERQRTDEEKVNIKLAFHLCMEQCRLRRLDDAICDSNLLDPAGQAAIQSHWLMILGYDLLASSLLRMAFPEIKSLSGSMPALMNSSPQFLPSSSVQLFRPTKSYYDQAQEAASMLWRHAKQLTTADFHRKLFNLYAFIIVFIIISYES